MTVRHELWDGNIHDHADQGVSIAVAADVAGRETTLLRFNCFDQEKSYIYGPENPDLNGLPAAADGAMGQLYRMDPIADGNPIGWTIKTLQTKLPKMLERAGYPQVVAGTDLAEVGRVLPEEMAASPFTCWRISAGRREELTSRKPRSWPSTVSGKPRITIMAHATRTTASFGTRHWSRTRSGGC